MQHRLVDAVARVMPGAVMLSQGDLGLSPGIVRPEATAKVEEVLAGFFGAEDALLVRGAGTGALREGLVSIIAPGEPLLVHDAPVYPTTRTTVDAMGLRLIRTDFNDPDGLARVFGERPDIGAVLIQYTRQKPDDRYAMGDVVAAVRSQAPDVPILTDDNYAVMKVRETGAELGADLSGFSLFKLMGPEGVGALIGKKRFVSAARGRQYSGGCQVQGHEALDALRGLVTAPVLLAVQGEVIEELCRRLNGGEVAGVSGASVANAQSKVVIAELEEANAPEVVRRAGETGAAAWPVGAESKYDLLPLVYKVSGTFAAANPGRAASLIRINPNKAGADTVIRILREAVGGVKCEV